MPASDIRALLDAVLPERSHADAAEAHDTRDLAAPSQRSLVIASLLRCPDRSDREGGAE